MLFMTPLNIFVSAYEAKLYLSIAQVDIRD